MPFIKTMKSQAVEAGATIATWPNDGIVNWFIPADDGDGTTAVEKITETELDMVGLIAATAGATCTFDLSGAPTVDAIASAGAIGNNSFVLFFVGDGVAIPAPLAQLKFGTAAGANIYMGSSPVQFNDSVATYTLDGFPDNGGAVDNLFMLVVDRENALVSAYYGTDGTTLLDSSAITETGTFNPVTNTLDSDSSFASITSFAGAGLLVFPNGIPANFASMMSYIADELRAGRKHTWMVNFVADYVL